MTINLLASVTAKAEAVAADTVQASSAATAMADILSAATSGYLGGDLTFSGGAGTANVTPASEAGRAVVKVNGVYVLANSGRHQSAGQPGGSWGGFGITEKHSAEAFAAGREAFLAGAKWGR